ncbi:hypothetical protein niasHT_028187 [Heterodera trifolii]|uniref:OTU domain-containing protein n=1 Tax=Heterodera trifolii TaxID=157864 RepID=A0ABD2JNX0_9BILA
MLLFECLIFPLIFQFSNGNEEKFGRKRKLEIQSEEIGRKRIHFGQEKHHIGNSLALASADNEEKPQNLQNPLHFLFNPPTEIDRKEFCAEWHYVHERGINFGAEFDFPSEEFGPGKVVPIESDGNCGFRSLSWILTGTEANHRQIRADIMKFLNSELINSEDDPAKSNWLEMFFTTKEEARQYAEMKRTAAENVGQQAKWFNEFDAFTASKLYGINVIICKKEKEDNNYTWHYFSPLMSDNLDAPQERTRMSAFIYNSPAHFEVILEPKERKTFGQHALNM